MKGYDQLSQSLATALTPGDTYVLSFSAYEVGGPNIWSKLSTDGDVNGGNGVDILAYVGGIDGPYGGRLRLSTWVMMLAGFLGLGVAGYRRARRAA